MRSIWRRLSRLKFSVGPLLLFLMFLLATVMPISICKCIDRKQKGQTGRCPWISIVTKWVIKGHRSQQLEQICNATTPGEYACNEMDMHANMGCAGSNWRVMELTGIECQVTPFLDKYDPVDDVPIARCVMVWTNKMNGNDYLLVTDQLLFFGTSLQHSLINPNQLQAYGIDMHDNPFDTENVPSIECDEVFIPFETDGTVIHFESRVPTDNDMRHLPVIILTADEWDPTSENIYPHKRTMLAVHSLTTGTML